MNNEDTYFEELNKEDKEELIYLQEKLKKHEDINTYIEDKQLKKRIAEICLKLFLGTPKNREDIKEVSYIITGYFFKNNYGDKLDSAMELASELELPEGHLSGDIFEIWEKFQNILEEYLK